MKSEEIDLAIKYYNIQIKTAKQALESLFILKEQAIALENGQLSLNLDSLK